MRFSVPDELVHQPVERFVRPQLRIVLGHDQQPRQRAALLVGRLDRLLRRLRAGELGARLGDLPEDVTLLLRDALDRLHQVGNQVVPPLQLVLDLRPTAS